MSDNLYREEALKHRNRSLYGEVILKSPPATWLITCLLLAVMCALGVMLFAMQIEGIPLWRWLFAKAG